MRCFVDYAPSIAERPVDLPDGADDFFPDRRSPAAASAFGRVCYDDLMELFLSLLLLFIGVVALIMMVLPLEDTDKILVEIYFFGDESSAQD